MHPSTMGVRGHRLRAAPTKQSAGSWKQLQEKYLTSTLSLRALAREAAVSYDALKRRARREGWAAQRAADVCMNRRRRDLEELALARDEARRAARRLLAVPARTEPAEVARVADQLVATAGLLWKRALHVAEPDS